MITLIYFTSYANSSSLWRQRYRKWVDDFDHSVLEFDQMLVVDDGSPTLPEWTDFEVVTDLIAVRPEHKKYCIIFPIAWGI